MIEEYQNFGLAGGTLKVVRSLVTALAFELTNESMRRWHEAEAQLYLELGLDAAEYTRTGGSHERHRLVDRLPAARRTR